MTICWEKLFVKEKVEESEVGAGERARTDAFRPKDAAHGRLAK